MLTDRLPAVVARPLARLVDGLMLLLCAFVAWYGARLCVETMGQSVAELPWLPVGVTYLAIPLGAAATFAFVLEHIVAGPQKGRAVVRIGEAH